MHLDVDCVLGCWKLEAHVGLVEVANLRDQIRSEQLAAWRTSSVRRSKPTSEGEARNGMSVIEETCWDAVPEHYRRQDLHSKEPVSSSNQVHIAQQGGLNLLRGMTSYTL